MVNRHPNIINNLEEQRKSLIDNNIPVRFYHPSNNRKIKKYFEDNEVRFTCDEDSYMSLEDFIHFVENLKKSNTCDSAVTTTKNLHSAHTVEVDVIDLTEETYSLGTLHKSNRNPLPPERKVHQDPPFHEINGQHRIQKNKHKTLFSSSEDENLITIHKESNTSQRASKLKSGLSNGHVTSAYNVNKGVNNAKLSSACIINKKPPVSLKSHDEEILNSLLEHRSALAKKLHIQDPEQFISTNNLKLIIIHNPTTLDELRNLRLIGFKEEYIQNYGYDFLAITQSYNCG